jgi:hypothetical protein
MGEVPYKFGEVIKPFSWSDFHSFATAKLVFFSVLLVFLVFRGLFNSKIMPLWCHSGTFQGYSGTFQGNSRTFQGNSGTFQGKYPQAHPRIWGGDLHS